MTRWQLITERHLDWVGGDKRRRLGEGGKPGCDMSDLFNPFLHIDKTLILFFFQLTWSVHGKTILALALFVNKAIVDAVLERGRLAMAL